MSRVLRGVPSRGPLRAAALSRVMRRTLRGLSGVGDGRGGRVLLHTLTMTRWVAVIGQLFAILFVHFSLGIELPLAALLPAVVLSALVNLALVLGLKATTRLPERGSVLLFAYDISQLCWLLAFTGGIQNPFASLVLVPVALASATLSLRATAAIAALGLVGLAALGLVSDSLPWREAPLTLPPLYRFAIWAGLCIATLLISVFVWSIAEEARRRAEALHVTQMALAREQQMSALGGQAAAAAHLLGTPLGTITIIAKELLNELDGGPLAEESHELYTQALRCRELLKGLGRPSPGQGEHERFTRAPLSSQLETLAADLARPGRTMTVRVEVEDGTAEPSLVLRPEIRHSIANLIENAVRFARTSVIMRVCPSRDSCLLEIEDDGPGFPPEVLDWLGEPFLSTRREEGGLGLGIFIADTLLARTGATLHFENAKDGARVTIAWPAAALENGQLGAEE